jgi:hypothetical protein
MAWIFNVVEKNGEIILRCAIDPLEATARVSEMPQWMFDPVICSQIRYSVLPIVDCEALRELKRLLTDKCLAAQLNVVQAEHRPLSFTGSIRAIGFPTLARYLPAMANRSFIVRWQNGTDAAMDSSFRAYVETAIAGMEQALARA